MSSKDQQTTIPTGLGIAIVALVGTLIVLGILLFSLPSGHGIIPGNELRISATLKNLVLAQVQYQALSPNGSFAPNLKQLFDADFLQGMPLIPEAYLDGEESGYRFSMDSSDFWCPGQNNQSETTNSDTLPQENTPPALCRPAPGLLCATHGQPGAWHRFSVQAHPLQYGESGRRSFHIDEEGLLMAADLEGKEKADWVEAL